MTVSLVHSKVQESLQDYDGAPISKYGLMVGILKILPELNEKL
jgi:hypothetical protein